MSNLVSITEPVLDWTGVYLDPSFHDPSRYKLTYRGSRMYFECYVDGYWSLPIEWVDGAHHTVWDLDNCWADWSLEVRSHKKNIQVSLLRNMDMVREKREKICARIAHLSQVLGEPALDIEAIKQRHLGGDVQRTLYDGHVLTDLALVIKELERYRGLVGPGPAKLDTMTPSPLTDVRLGCADMEDLMQDKFMVFDVESIGLHGEGFAVGWVVVNRGGARLAEGLFVCDPDQCAGQPKDREWVRAHVPAMELTHKSPADVHSAFWAEWLRWTDQGAVLVADCAWPVEANFLSACVRSEPGERAWTGPYPLLDLASVIWVKGGDPLAVSDRLADELPAHHPLMDARQSARQLLDWLSGRQPGFTRMC